MKFGIAGFGFVGKATSLFENTSTQLLIYDIDPTKSNCTLLEFIDSQIIFICLPTPMNLDGRCNTKIIENFLLQIQNSKALIIVRSTVPIGFCDQKHVYFMPEFLTEKNWKDDFIQTKYWIVGCPSGSNDSEKSLISKLIQSSYNENKINSKEIIWTNNSTLEISKLVKNAFLSTKVSFFNEIYELANKYPDVDYSKMVDILKLDDRIGKSHMLVPSNGKRGYGGTCFPKDTLNLYSLFCSSGLKSRILSSNLDRNEFVDRKDRDWLSDYNRTITQTSKKVILVTGGCGFIGSNLCERFLKDSNNFVLCLDNLSSGRISNVQHLFSKENFLFIQHDITERLFLPKVDMIYHLACPASPPEYQKNPIKTIKTCIDGLWNILKLCKQNRCKMLFSSTSEIYGDPLQHPQKETYWGNVNPLGTRSCYDESKRLSETIIYEYRKKHKLDLKIVRIFNTYGPKMRLDDGRIITNIISCHLEKKTLIVNGNGKQTRSFCYIDDMLDGLIAMMNSEEMGPINLGNPDCEVTINQLIEIFNASVSKINVEYKNYDLDDPKQRRPDISLANKRLDWHPQISIRDGFLNTVYKFLHEKDG